MDQQQQLSGGGGGSDVINLNNIGYGANSNENSQQADSDSNLLSNNDKALNNNENINPVGAMPIKMDINQLLSQIMSITSQSLKDAQDR